LILLHKTLCGGEVICERCEAEMGPLDAHGTVMNYSVHIDVTRMLGLNKDKYRAVRVIANKRPHLDAPEMRHGEHADAERARADALRRDKDRVGLLVYRNILEVHRSRPGGVERRRGAQRLDEGWRVRRRGEVVAQHGVTWQREEDVRSGEPRRIGGGNGDGVELDFRGTGEHDKRTGILDANVSW